MQFEVQGQNYFLRFLPGQGRWYLFKPTLTGLTGMPVLDDGGTPPPEGFPVLDEEDEQESVVN